MEECVFCKIVKGELPCDKVYDDENFIGFLDIRPKAEGHTLIVSKKHFTNALDLPVSLGNELLEAIKIVGMKLIEEKKSGGFNVIFNTGSVAGQIIHHFHCHIIPRRGDDGLHILV